REDGQDLMYIFNYEDGGFVIVGSTRNYYPILAYSDKGSFELQDDMGPVDVWLDETKVSIKNSGSLDNETKAQMQNLWERYDGTFVDPAQELLAARRPQTRSAGEDSCWAEIERLQAQYGSEGWTFLPLSFVEDLFDDLGLYNEYANICYYAAQNHSALNETVIGYKNPVHNEVGPLIGTNWHQVSPFDDLCPGDCPAGCGPVAVAQLMKFYEKPTSMTWNVFTFGWDRLPPVPDVTDTTERHAHLIRYLWQKLQVTVSPPLKVKTSATKIKNGLESMGYTANISNPHSNASVKEQLLIYSRPVIMYGRDSSDTDGHFWVCEGAKEIDPYQIIYYTENQPYGAGTFTQGMYSLSNPGIIGGGNPSLDFYMNWGWGVPTPYSGPLNGWFSSNNVSVDTCNFVNDRKDIFVSYPTP
nr:C10 family peptidase [Bacteroidales bacterium]